MDDDLSLDRPELALALPADRPITTVADTAASLAAAAPGARVHLTGVEGSAGPLVAAELVARGAKLVYVTATAELAERAAADLGYLLARRRAAPAPVLRLQASDSPPWAEVHPDRRAGMSRASALFHLASGRPWSALVVPAAALARRVAPAERLREGGLRVRPEERLDAEQSARALTAGGYLRVPLVEDPGSFAVRGGVLDVWPAGADAPVRIELWGDLVASLRSFDPDDQRTLEPVLEAWIPPAREAVVTTTSMHRAQRRVRELCDAVNYPSVKARQLVEDVAAGKLFFGAEAFLPAYSALDTLFDALPSDALIVLEDAPEVVGAIRAEWTAALSSVARRAGSPHFPFDELYLDEAELVRRLSERRHALLHRAAMAGAADGLGALEVAPLDAPTLAARDHADLERAGRTSRKAGGKQAGLEPLLRRLELWREAGLEVELTARIGTQADRLATLLAHRGVQVQVVSDAGAASGGATSDELEVRRRATDAVRIAVGSLARGVTLVGERLVLVTEEEIFGHRAHRPRTRAKTARGALDDLRALSVGDFVVHVEHGIGRYVGLEKRALNGATVELLVVEYAGGKLYLPVHRMNQVQKHASADGAAPKLDRLGGTSFAKTKAKVARRVRQMADDLLRLYAERNALRKDPLPEPDDDYAAFEATFPYEETRDQAAAIADVHKDLSSDRVMDRLVCGDVGFGKTEVAIRAAFRVAMAGRQVALLCPTTVLAQQHFLNLSARFANYPIRIGSLSRFETKQEQAATIKGLREGSVDVVVGTHRLLSKDVHFAKLGLLVVDEEQRFGVSHKERIKQIRASVDALTLTATPIPRTLQMAIGGVREMSLVTTPPVDRRATRTITTLWDAALLREAIERELARGGQVFYVYNRVEDLPEKVAALRELTPRARIVMAHGQMSEEELEQAMISFVDGHEDILVSTAIIESGLDIPRANTMIIDRADLFGLAQLYQLRGRVGRSSERAYCYLVTPPASAMTDESRMRIEALEKHTELGSGFQIAALDMELRGAGELLGAEQSGFATQVGFDLFCHMLEQATQELRGEVVVPDIEPELTFDVDALIPEEYVADVGVRLSFYKRLSSAQTEADVDEAATELEDRFGEAPLEARRFVQAMRLKAELRRLRVLGMEASAKGVTLHLRADTPLDPAAVGRLVASPASPFRISKDGRISRRPRDGEQIRDGLTLAEAALGELAACVRV